MINPDVISPEESRYPDNQLFGSRIDYGLPLDHSPHRLISLVNVAVGLAEQALSQASGGNQKPDINNIGYKRPIEEKGCKYANPDALAGIEDEVLRAYLTELFFYSNLPSRIIDNRSNVDKSAMYGKCWNCPHFNTAGYGGFDPEDPKNYSSKESEKDMNEQIKDVLRKRLLYDRNITSFCLKNYMCEIRDKVVEDLYAKHEKINRTNYHNLLAHMCDDDNMFFSFPIATPQAELPLGEPCSTIPQLM